MKLQQVIQERQSEVEHAKQSMDVIGEHPKESQIQSKELIGELEEEISELLEQSSELEKLSHTEDSLQFVQVC